MAGSPANALWVKPPFHEYHFIDLDKLKIQALEELCGERQDVYLYHGDCNKVLLGEVLPRVRYEDFRRALCILDPYKINLQWAVIDHIGKMRSVDIFLNFPIADINRNVLRRDRKRVAPAQAARMDRFWGDDSWQDDLYTPSKQEVLFGEPDVEKARNDTVAEVFRARLQTVAGFKHVPKPVAMRNSTNAIVYYLFFASHKPVAENIVHDIFRKYEKAM